MEKDKITKTEIKDTNERPNGLGYGGRDKPSSKDLNQNEEE
jgi:hypothetical protein